MWSRSSVGDVLLDVVEVVGHTQHGLHQPPRHHPGQESPHPHDGAAAHQDGGQRVVVEGPDGLGVLAGAQDVAVGQQHGVVVGLVAGGDRIADVLPAAGGEGLLHLGAGEMVLHLGLLVGVGGLIQHLPVRRDEGEADAVGGQGVQAGGVVGVLGRHEGGLVLQRAPRLPGEGPMKDKDAGRHRQHQTQQAHQVEPAADGLLHAAGPHSSPPSSLSASL